MRDILRGDLTLRAMSLVYTTLLSIVPLIALSFSVLKGLGYHRELEPVLYSFLEPLGDAAYELTAQVMGFVDNVRGDVLGSLGLIFLLYTVDLDGAEGRGELQFRLARRAAAQLRPPLQRVPERHGRRPGGDRRGVRPDRDHRRNSSVVRTLSQYEPFGTMLVMFGQLTPYLLVTGVFTFLYAFMPNTKVRLRAALIGGVAAGIALGGERHDLRVVRRRARARTMVIYAGFAIVIVALIWLYVSWLILLLGAQLSFYVQNPQYLRPGRGEIQLNASLRERVALSIMYLIVQRLPDCATIAGTPTGSPSIWICRARHSVRS